MNAKRWLWIAVVLSLLIAAVLPAAAQQRGTYTVQPGDTVTSIAVKFGVTVQSLVQLNGIANPSLIFVGQVLVIPPTGGTTTTTRTYVVRKGDTLKIIAAKFRTTWQALAQINQLANPNLIFVGQRLTLPPVGGPVVQPTPIPVVPTRYVVHPGDTLFKIGARFGRNIWAIAQANGILNLNQIFTGQVLVIP
jgi:LysM repeat protein